MGAESPFSIQSSAVYHFGVFQADPRSGELRKKGLRVSLQDKPFQLLVVLLQAEGRVVTREDIRRKLWSEGTFVEFDDNLNAAVKKLRAALNDSAEHPRFLETVPRVGYRFVAPLTTTPADIAGRIDPGASPAEESATSSTSSLKQSMRDGASVNLIGINGSIHDETTRRRFRPFIASSLKSAKPVAIFVTLLCALILLGLGVYSRKPSAEAKIQSIAVLPLEDLSADPQQQYFADGMTDELITDLARFSSLSVISRTSAMQYRATKKTLPVIGRELNVDAVVEGSVVRSGNKVRITVQLINTRNDRHLWAESYEREAGDLVTLQNEVADAIAEQIRIKLTPADKQRLFRRPVNPEAHEAYLKGLYFWNERTADSLKTSFAYFEDAIRKDPNYALAYSGLADAYDVASDYDLLSPRDSYSKTKAAVLKALELDPSLAQAHATLADMRSAYEWDWSGAEAEFKRALELNPGYATAHHWYAQYLTSRGRHEEALAEIHRAMELDPLSPSINAYAGSAFYMAREYDMSVEQLLKMIEAEPSYAVAHYFLGFSREQRGELKEAIKEFQKAVALSGGEPSYLAGLAHAYALSGDQQKSRAICKKLQERAHTEYVSSYDIALIYAGLREKQQVLEWLKRAYEEDDPNMNLLNVEPAFDDFHLDAAFRDMLQRMGLIG
jgi:TolB-like protein/DNA-binding winged helix-turn-helix (wHTH) protein/Tfp pilus assembly protein PilF